MAFGRWCLARVSFNYPTDFVSSGGWEALFQAASGSDVAPIIKEAYGALSLMADDVLDVLVILVSFLCSCFSSCSPCSPHDRSRLDTAAVPMTMR